jgi:phage terminase large subunit-like protein
MTPGDKALARWGAFLDEAVDLVRMGASKDALAEHRRLRTRNDPALFALVYLSRHLADPATGRVTLSDVHVAWAKSAKTWRRRAAKPMSDRRAEVAPREMGKSTWWFLILPMWAAAHGHVGFAAAFADTDTQAQTHLASFKAELDTNALIREDFPDLCHPKTRGRGTVEADRVSLYHARSGFVFAAAGMDSSNLGMKVGDRRPDLIILDDIEPHEARYSAALAKKRLNTLREAILPLNVYAHVVLVGTVTMQGSIVHQVVRYLRGERDEADDASGNAWVGEDHIGGRHTLPIITKADGTRASIWPSKWPLDFLESIEGTRGYLKNYANDPLGADGDYWTLDDITKAREVGKTMGLGSIRGAAPIPVTRILVEVDPAVTTKKSSDYTAIAVIGWQPPPKGTAGRGRCIVLEARQVKKTGAAIRLDVLDTVQRWNAGLVRIESNQGGDLWEQVLWGMPVKVRAHPAGTASKEVRAAEALDHYQRGRVGHLEGAALRDAEGQMVAFPNAPHDDLVDAVGAGVRYFLAPRKARADVGGSSAAYV